MTKTAEIRVDAEFEGLIPPLDPEEYRTLEQNLLADGCRDPLVVWDGVLIDGHNRYKLCRKHGLGFQTREINLADRTAAKVWIIRNQFGRRNLPPFVRAELALLLEPLVAAKAKANQVVRKPGQVGASPQTSADLSPVETRREVARVAGTSHDTIDKVKRIKAAVEEGVIAPDALDRLRTGEDTVNKVFNDVRREEKRAEVVAELEDIATKEAKAAEGVYDVVVLDPPWAMEKIERDVRPNQVEFDYPTMSEEDLAQLDIPTADDAHVWVWTTHKFLPMALRLLDAWGLKYVCTFVWHKPGGFQPIGLPQYNCEFALYARKGSPKFVDTKAFPVCFEAPRGAHSEKPEAFYDVVRRVTAGRRLDMFNRRPIDGFDRWGNES